MNKAELRKRFRELESKGAALIAAAGDKPMTAEQRSELSGITEEMDEIRGKLDQIEAAEEAANEERALRSRFGGAPARQRGDDPFATANPGPRGGSGESRSDYHSWPVEEAGEFFRAARSHTLGGDLPSNLRAEYRSAFMGELEMRAPSGQSTLIDADGGFLVPSSISAAILEKMHSEGQIVSRCQPVRISVGNTTKWNAIQENARTSGNRYGGITVARTGESEATVTSKAKFSQVALQLKKLTAGVYMTEEVIEDAQQITGIVTSLVPKALTFAIEDEIYNGLGAHQMEGILNAPALVTVAKESGQTAATVVFANIVKMWSRMHASSWANSVWFINQNVLPQLFTMSLAVGTGGAPAYLPANGLASSPFGTLMGRPVIPVEHAATLGTVGDIVLADMSQYLYATKGGVRSASSIHVRFLEGETVWRFAVRNDGKSWWPAALTPANGSDTLSPFVALATRA